MANFRKPHEQPGAGAGDPPDSPERLNRTLGESAQQVWLAGIGALGRAQVEGSRLFESLVQEGSTMERGAREFADGQAQAARNTFESNVDSARHRMTDGWGRLEKSFDERIQQTLGRIGVPTRDEWAALNRRVDALTAEVRKKNGGAVPRSTTSAPHPPAAKRAARPAVRKPAAKKAAPRKTVRSTSAKP